MNANDLTDDELIAKIRVVRAAGRRTATKFYAMSYLVRHGADRDQVRQMNADDLYAAAIRWSDR